MKLKYLAIFIILLSGLSLNAQINKTDADFVKNVFYPATALLYSQDESGTMKMRCTATAIEKNAAGYIFVTAAHCGCNDNVETHTVSPEKAFFFITADSETDKRFLNATPIACGYRHAGDDFFLLQVDTQMIFPTVELGEDPVIMEAVVNVASPLGIGKQVFLGTVSSPSLNRPVVDDDINWTHASLLELFGTDGGSSGSAVVCLDQHKICGFVVGSVNKTSIIAMPISRLKKMLIELKAGAYKHYIDDPDAVVDKPSKTQ
jgi:trypsin-like peptidase